jgi:hypothetical protein
MGLNYSLQLNVFLKAMELSPTKMVTDFFIEVFQEQLVTRILITDLFAIFYLRFSFKISLSKLQI